MYVYSSATLIGLVPPGVTTETSSSPALVALGMKTLICVALMTLKHPAPEPGHGYGLLTGISLLPTNTSDAENPLPTKCVPLIVTRAPPPCGPSVGVTPVTDGGGAETVWPNAPLRSPLAGSEACPSKGVSPYASWMARRML